MSPERTAVTQLRSGKLYNPAARPLAVLLAVCCWLSTASGQWLEKTIGLSDSFGSIWPTGVYFVPSGNCVYVADCEDGDVVVVDATTNARTGRRVMDLVPGANDVRTLAPGVYFIRQTSDVRQDASSVTKVIITR